MVQKSGYFARSAASNSFDRHLIQGMADLAVDSAFRGQSGVVGHDEEDGNRLKTIDFKRIAGGKAFNVNQRWFVALMNEIGQKLEPAAPADH